MCIQDMINAGFPLDAHFVGLSSDSIFANEIEHDFEISYGVYDGVLGDVINVKTVELCTDEKRDVWDKFNQNLDRNDGSYDEDEEVKYRSR